MQLTGNIFDLVPAEIAGWLAVAFGLAFFGLLVRVDQARKTVAGSRTVMPVRKPQASPARLEPGSAWQRVTHVAFEQCTSARELPQFQSRAAEQLDAAEHPLARLLAECASAGCHFARPQPEPVLQLVRQPVRPPVPRTLAA